jgi:phosphoglycolate phosphatase-like HAD superfamily hydrolase
MVIMFDLDGVLFRETTYYPQTQALVEAVYHVHGVGSAVDWIGEIDRHGKTDMQVARQLHNILIREKLTTDKFEYEDTAETYKFLFKRYCPKDLYDEIAPYAELALWKLRGHRLVLATGNLEDVARHKIQHAGLSYMLNLDRSGYGDNTDSRADILRKTAPEGSIYVCDTPADVEAGVAWGMRCMGVPSPEVEDTDLLLEAGAEAVFENLSMLAYKLSRL